MNDRLKLLMRRRRLNVIRRYTLKADCPLREKEENRTDFAEGVRELPESEALLDGAGLNGRMGEMTQENMSKRVWSPE